MVHELTLLVLFFLSGAAGLMYEVLWTERFTLVIGHSVVAFSAVVAAFMGGLALGSWLAGRITPRLHRGTPRLHRGTPRLHRGTSRLDRRVLFLKAYAYLEFGVCLYALIFPSLAKMFEGWYPFLAAHSPSWFHMLVFKFMGVGVLLIVPTTFLGATFPFIAHYAVSRSGRTGRSVGRLYFVNSLGAAAGALMCGFWLLRVLGWSSTLYVAIALSAVAAGGALLLASRCRAGHSQELPPESGSAPDGTGSPVPTEQRVRWLLLAYFATGASAMMLQIAWSRLLTLLLGSSTYSITLILGTYILGLSLGSLIASRFADRFRTTRQLDGVLGVILGSTWISALLALPVFGVLPYLFLKIRPLAGTSFTAYLGMEMVLCALVMLLPTVGLGAAMPVVVRRIVLSRGLVGRDVASVYAVNTLACIVGSSLTGLVLLSWLGLRHTLELGVGILAVISMACLMSATRSSRFRLAIPAVCVIVAGIYLVFCPPWDPSVLNSGVFYRPKRFSEVKNFSDFRQALGNSDFLFYEEGLSVTAGVLRLPNGVISLLINGKNDASTGNFDVFTQKFMAHLTVLLTRDTPKSSLVIGLGSGMTVGSLSLYPFETIDCVELSPEVERASRFFADSNFRFWQDPRVRVIIDDARSYVLTTDRTYDLIISEPSNPWIAGIGSLYTVEHFSNVKRILQPGGVFLQWIQRYESSSEVFQIALRTFQSVFPHTELWYNGSGDSYLVGSDQPFDHLRLGDRFFNNLNPKASSDLASMGITSPVILAYNLCFDEEHLGRYVAPGPVNSDDFQLISYLAPLHLFRGSTVTLSPKHLDGSRLASRYVSAFGDKVDVDTFLHLAAFLYRYSFPEAFIRSALQQALQRDPKSREVNYKLAWLDLLEGKLTSARSRAETIIKSDPGHIKTNVLLGDILFEHGLVSLHPKKMPWFEQALAQYREALAIGADSVDVLSQIAYLQKNMGNVDGTIETYGQLIVELEKRAAAGSDQAKEQLYYNLKAAAEVYRSAGLQDQARSLMQKAGSVQDGRGF